MEPVFIVAQYKSGTSWLLRALSAHPDILGIAEIDVIRAAYEGSPPRARLRPVDDRLRMVFSSSAWSREDVIPDLEAGRHPTARKTKDNNPRSFRDLDEVTATIMYRRIKWANHPHQVLDAFHAGVTAGSAASFVVYKAADQIALLSLLDRWKPEGRKIAITRDGRDAAISAEHYKRLMEQSEAPWYSGSREYSTLLGDWADRADRIIHYARSGELYLMRYEDLTADFEAAFGELLDWLGAENSREIMDAVVAKSSFEASTGRKRGSDGTGVIRKGAVGEWLEALDEETKATAWALAGPKLAALGYTREGPIEPLPDELRPATALGRRC